MFAIRMAKGITIKGQISSPKSKAEGLLAQRNH